MSSSTPYFFIFGRNAQLSLAELSCYFISHNLSAEIVCLSKSFLITKIKGKFNPVNIASKLAGIIKLGRIYTSSNQPNEFYELLLQHNFYFEDVKTLNYAVSIHGKKIGNLQLLDLYKTIYKNFNQKALLKKPKPSSLINFLQRHNFVDLVICVKDGTYYFGRTIASYDIKKNKIRYEQRPHVDESIGSSIRFSRILVNLSQKKEGILLDPFCGIGTVLQEALLLGFDVLGSELDKNRVKFSKANLKWLSNRCELQTPKFKVIQTDARQIHRKIAKESIDTVVTEPELGPLLKKIPVYNEAKSIITTLEKLYAETFSAVDLVLKKGGTMVIVLPKIYSTNGTTIKPSLNKLVESTHLKTLSKISLGPISVSLPIEYKEPYHLLGRLVYIFQKQ